MKIFYHLIIVARYNVVDVCTPINLKDGLITPVIFDAEKKGLLDINKDLKNIIEKAKDGSLQPQEVQVRFVILQLILLLFLFLKLYSLFTTFRAVL